MLTALDICNLALDKLGENPIHALDPFGPPAARLCVQYYHQTRREVLGTMNPSFARQVEILDAGGRDCGFRLPGDCLRILNVSDDAWSLRGRTIYAPSSRITLTYIADVEDCDRFSELFTEALSTRLACVLCIPLTSSSSKRRRIRDAYQAFIPLPR